MKLVKKHAVALAKFVDVFLGEQYYPFDKREEETITKVAAFAVHHDLFFDDSWHHFENRLLIDRPKKVARLDIDERDAEILISMIGEVYEKEPASKETESAVRYLRKEFFQA